MPEGLVSRHPPAPGEMTRLSRLLMPSHRTWEISVYTGAWIFSVLYAIYNVYRASRYYFHEISSEELEVGWFGSSKWRKDVSDFEWHVFSDIILKSTPWLLIHVIGSVYFKKFNSALIPLFYFLLGAIWVSKVIGQHGLGFLCVQPVCFFLVYRLTRSATLVYALSLFFVVGQDHWPLRSLLRQSFHEDEYRERYIASVAYAWINSRCMSFCLDHLWGEVESAGSWARDLVELMAHCFYLPVGINGPIINFKEFCRGIRRDWRPFSEARLFQIVLAFLRYSFWFLVNNLLLHFFYFSALQFNTDIMEDVDLWTLCGIGYSMGQFFHMKYIVFYGFPQAFLLTDDVEGPTPPKCIGRIHLYSDMWRYFDNGLYKFIHKYFYQPVVGRFGRGIFVRLLASFLTFSFVFVWHGMNRHVLIWSVLNFVGISLEAAARELGEWQKYQRYERSLLSPKNRRRFYSLLGAPLFLMSILSNFYFFMGDELGHLFVARGLSSWPVGTPLLLIVMYFGAQTSFEMRNWDIRARLTRET